MKPGSMMKLRNQAAVEKEHEFRNHDESKVSRLYDSFFYTTWLWNDEEEDNENEEECSEFEHFNSCEEGVSLLPLLQLLIPPLLLLRLRKLLLLL